MRTISETSRTVLNANTCENTNSLDYSTIALLGDVNGKNSYLLYKDDGVTTEIDMTSNIVELK